MVPGAQLHRGDHRPDAVRHLLERHLRGDRARDRLAGHAGGAVAARKPLWFIQDPYPAFSSIAVDPVRNEIAFPAAILQPPFFDLEADPAVNYGAIGAVIGHEISHGFDDQGRKSDGDGRLSEWWTKEDEVKFMAQAERLGAQYAAVEILPGATINGELTMGENIADLGGLLLALDAYRLSLKGQPAPVIDGYTGEQRFFIGWAQGWARNYREVELRRLSPAEKSRRRHSSLCPLSDRLIREPCDGARRRTAAMASAPP